MPAKRSDAEIKDMVINLLIKIGFAGENKKVEFEKCYGIKTHHFLDNGLAGLLQKFKGSAVNCLMFCFPEYSWDILRFEKKPQGFWKDPINIRLQLEKIQKERGWTTLEDMYKLTKNDIPQGLHDRFPSVIKLLEVAYPEHEWDPILFDRIPNGTWDNFETHVRVVKRIETELGIKNPEDWYSKLTSDIFNERFGTYLLEHYYDWSPTKLICTVYPELKSRIWLFPKTPNSFWKNEENVRMFLHELFKHLTLESVNDWYKITCDDFDSFGGAALVNIYGGHIETIIRFADVPDGFVWNRGKFRSTWTTERYVGDHLVEIGRNILRGPEFSPEWLKNKTSPYKMDITITDIQSCIEVDGPGHFRPMWYGTHESTFDRDILKMKKAVENGYSGMRLVQEDVYKNTFDWKRWIQGAITLIQSSQTPVWIFPENCPIYKSHIEQCQKNNIDIALLRYD